MNPHDRLLLDAARRGDAEAAAGALAAGAAVEARDEQLRTPLLHAALGDHLAVAELLLAAGADPNAPDSREDSPWLVTGVTGSVRMMRLLLPAGPDLKQRNRFGGISLIPAAERGHAAYVRAVLDETDIDVDHVNRLGWTALLEAVILGDGGPRHEEIVATLLGAGADPALADHDGVTPYEHAARRGFDGMARILRAAEAAASVEGASVEGASVEGASVEGASTEVGAADTDAASRPERGTGR